MVRRGAWSRILSRPIESYNPTWLGAVALAVIGVLVAGMLTVKASGIGYTRYTAEFAQAASLKTGQNVSLAGISVGVVASTKLVGDHVEVGLRVRDDVRLRKDAKAAIKVATFLGSRYVELRNAGEGALEDRTIDLAHTEVPYDLQATLADATTTFEQVDADKIAQSAAVLAKQLEGLPAVVPQAMQNIQTLSTIIARRRDQIGTLFKNTATVTTTLRGQQAEIGKLINQGQDLLGEFVSRRNSFHSMMAAITSLVTVLNKIVVKDRTAADKLVVDLRTFTDMLGQHDDLFRSLLEIMPVTVRNAANAVGSGNAVDLHVANGIVLDSWACAISGRAKQFNMIPYFKDCK